MNKEEIKNDIFEVKMYITDLETEQKSKEIDVSDLIFNDYIEFEFGNYGDEDYGTLPYKDFKFFINDYSVTFYSPQFEKLQQENKKYKEVIKEASEYIKEKTKIISDEEGGGLILADYEIANLLEILSKGENK